MIRYYVEVCDFGPQGRTSPIRKRHHLSLPQARRIAEREARKGLVRFGGTIARQAWGARGGDFPRCYRSAVIYARGYRA